VILLWGLGTESTWRAVLERLRDRGADVLALDQAERSGRLELDLTLEAGCCSGNLIVHGREVALPVLTSAYLRPYDPLAFAYTGPDADGDRSRALDFSDLLWAWADLAPGLVVNRPAHMAAGGSKPGQGPAIRRAGFHTPQTLVTNDPAAAESFWRCHGRVVFKSLSGVRSIVHCLEPFHEAAWADVGTCPVQFQAYVPGTDYRVHIVGDQVFAARVMSDAVDYRYPSPGSPPPEVAPVRLDRSVERRCLELARANRLVVSGIDLRRTPTGDWYCFEINPAPAFAFFDVDGEVSEAVAALLDSDRTRPDLAYPLTDRHRSTATRLPGGGDGT